jgi:hypothetical protein
MTATNNNIFQLRNEMKLGSSSHSALILIILFRGRMTAKIINIQRCFKRCRRCFHAKIAEYSGALKEEKAGK